MDKKILPIVVIAIVLAVAFIYFEFLSKPNPNADIKKFDEFIKSNLKPEYRPSSISLVVSNSSSKTMQGKSDLYIYSYSWDVSNDTLIFSVNYNDKKSGIDTYTMSVRTAALEKLDKEAANSLSEKYFTGLPSLQWECEGMPCLASWEEENNKKGINIFMPSGDTFVWLWMLPPESESR